MAEVKTRDQIPMEETWDSASVYPTAEAWQAEFDGLEELVAPIRQMRGMLTTPAAIAKIFLLEDALEQRVERLYLYAHMLEDQDTTVSANQARMGTIRGRLAMVQGELAWIVPEILSQDEATLTAWSEAPELKDYRRSMVLLARQKPHTLSAAEETILGRAGEVLGTPAQAFGMLCNADLEFAPAADAQGQTHTVTNGSYQSLLLKTDRTLRENSFRSIYAGYGGHRNTIATLLAGTVKTHVLNAQLRGFPSALDAALFPDNVPATVYHALIAAVDEALPVFHRFVDLRAEKLGLGEAINMWDLHVPIVPDFEIEVSWEQCRQWIMDSLAPLGDEYLAGASQAFTERWADIRENKGKRSGAYSTGAYACKPFMLLNYHGTLDDVFTVAHELGHSMHTWFSHRNQPYRYSDYPIFLAEIASTTNEALLLAHLLETAEDPRMRAYLLNHYCDGMRGTLFRQTMFAQFELELHRRAETGEPLTAEDLAETYYALNARHYGPRLQADRQIGLEWLRIPHFYYNFYVYKYATGFSAAQVFAQRIQQGGAARDAYLGFLKSGSSRDPLDTVRAAGVDLADVATVRQAFERFDAATRELAALLQSGKMGTQKNQPRKNTKRHEMKSK